MNNERKTSDAQIRASRRWEEENPEKKRYQRVRSNARTFARKYARSREEVEELLGIFDEENSNATK
ncbi:hypothetical protein QO008_000474 [Peptoniphilus ivorii]|uniref:hypothetical protein n=1 Tax=Aedoeadaptatus ivorii TaxID=54006 RepID=UPI000F82E3A5|nr:hypothetical protein [Peptoniphilus ivorii]MDQ0508030.1 hypothetical protein [Peptoniphilus ivorii]